MTNQTLSAERARDIFAYDPLTGAFTHRCGPRIGRPAGSTNALGYVCLSNRANRWLAHRVAWLMVHGNWPANLIDHVNGDPSDNRIENLREADKRLNAENRRHAQSNNSSGMLGVKHQHGKYQAVIRGAGVTTHLGTFDTPDEAHQAYLTAKRELHAGCTI